MCLRVTEENRVSVLQLSWAYNYEQR